MRRSITLIISLLMFAVAPHSSGAPLLDGPGYWVPTLPMMPYGQTTLSLFQGGEGFAWGSQSGADFLYKTTDFGTTWVPLLPPPANNLVQMGGPENGYAQGINGAFFQTIDGGVTWRNVNGLPLTGRLAWGSQTMGTANHGRTVAAFGTMTEDTEDICDGPADDHLTVFISHDAGHTWGATEFPFWGFAWDSQWYSPREAAVTVGRFKIEQTGDCSWAGSASPMLVFITDDGGASFHRIFKCRVQCTGIEMISPHRIIVGYTGGGFEIIDEKGKSLATGSLLNSLETECAFGPAVAFDFADRKVGYASVNGCGIFRTTNSGVTWVFEPSSENVYGVGFGDVAAADRDRVIAGGEHTVLTRTSGP